MNAQVLSQPFAKINLMNLPRMSRRKVLLFGFILIAALLFFYIFQISQITQDSFSIAKHKQEILGLSQYNKNLEIIISRNNSQVNLETILKKLNYEKVNKIYYIQTLDQEMAVK